MHACQYRKPDDLVGRTVVVVGGANTAGDIAVEIGNVAKQVWGGGRGNPDSRWGKREKKNCSLRKQTGPFAVIGMKLFSSFQQELVQIDISTV